MVLDKVAKATAAAPVGVIGAALWVVGTTVGGIGKVSGISKVAKAGGSLRSVGSSAVETSQTLAQEAVGISNDSDERNKALQKFTEYTNSKNYLDAKDVCSMVEDMPELYFGLEGITGTPTEIQQRASKLLLKRYGRAECMEWEGFWDMWKKVIEDSQGRMSFYHLQIFSCFDVEEKGSLTMGQVSHLLDALYFNEDSAFSGDARIPDKAIITNSLLEEYLNGDIEGRLTQLQLSPILRGEFCASSFPQDEEKKTEETIVSEDPKA